MHKNSHHANGFTLVEILITVIILGIIATIATDSIANAEANLRAERAAREAVTAIRFARSRAMSDGTTYKVRFNVAGKTISVIDPGNSDALLAAPTGGGTMLITLSGKTDVAGVTMTPAITGDAADPYDISFSATGATTNSGTILFTYGVSSKTLQIPSVGDPTIQGDIRRP